MAAERNARRRPTREAAEALQPTVTVDALDAAARDDGASVVEMHRRVAARLLREGAPSRAFGELVRASRALPMTPRLAAHLVAFSLVAGTEPAAVTLLQTGIDDTAGPARVGIRRQLARLFRRLQVLDRAREQLVLLLAERPGDRRARRVLNALLEREERWEELDASLEKEAKDALQRRALRHAARATLQRARLYERLANPPRAALRYDQAATYLEQDGDPEGAFELRILWLRALRSADAPARALEEATAVFRRSAAAAGQTARAETLLEALAGAGSGATARSKTQRELLIAAEHAEARGHGPAATALLNAAYDESPDPITQRRLEAHLVARRAWRELAQHYRDRIAKAGATSDKVELLTRLAELLEDELHELEGAARAYEEIVRLTGDETALREQVRLLAAKQDQSGVRRALDSAVDGAHSTRARIKALIARGEAALRKKELEKARRDFEEALRHDPEELFARAGLAEVGARTGDLEPLAAFRAALERAPRRFHGRIELLRRLGRLASRLRKETATAKWAWHEILSEAADDLEAEARLAEVARRTGDDDALARVLTARIRREPRGPDTRRARLEHVALLERAGRRDEALAQLREAVRFEPGHKEAWLLLSERLTARGEHGEAAWALEHAATSTPDPLERAQTWLRLAQVVRKSLRDPKRAAAIERRGRRILAEHAGSVPDTEPRAETPPPGAAGAGDIEVEDAHSAPTALEVPVVTLDDEPSVAAWREAGVPGEQSGAALVPWPEPEDGAATAPAVAGDVVEVTTGDILPAAPSYEHWEAPPGGMDDGPGTVELPVPLGRSAVSATPSLPPPSLQRLRSERVRLLQRVRDNPLDAEAYRALGECFAHVGDGERSTLMFELHRALEGEPEAVPRTPKLILSATDRAGLRHPALRGEAGELISLAGVALCQAHTGRIRGAQGREPFRMDSGRGAPAAAEALLAAVRILGLRAPDVYVAEENGPPFSLTWSTQGPRLLVGRLAVRRALPEAELRFFAGRALFTQNPDLLALRTLKKEQIARGLAVLSGVVRSGQQMSGEARAMYDGLSPRALPRIQSLLQTVGRTLELSPLSEAARHSVNRAGLVVAGGIAPALAALRAKKALPNEILELVRFAASERYLQLRTRRMG